MMLIAGVVSQGMTVYDVLRRSVAANVANAGSIGSSTPVPSVDEGSKDNGSKGIETSKKS